VEPWRPRGLGPFYTWAESKDYTFGTSVDGNIKATETAFNDAADTNAQPTSTNAFLNGVRIIPPIIRKLRGTSVIDFPMHWAFCNATHAFQNCANVDKYFNDCTYNVVYVNSHDYSPNGRCDMMPDYSEADLVRGFRSHVYLPGHPLHVLRDRGSFPSGQSDRSRRELRPHPIPAAPTLAITSPAVSRPPDLAPIAPRSGNLKDTLASTISQHLMKLSKIRQAVPALRYGQYTACTNNNMAFVKRYTSGSIDSVAAVAISSSYNFTGLPDGTYVDVVSGATKVVSGGTLSVSGLSQAKMAVYVLQNASSGTLSKIGGSTTYLA
jgi:hypothetical protein